MVYEKRYRAQVSEILNKIDDSLDFDYDASDSTFDILVQSKDLIEKMADEIAYTNSTRI